MWSKLLHAYLKDTHSPSLENPEIVLIGRHRLRQGLPLLCGAHNKCRPKALGIFIGLVLVIFYIIYSLKNFMFDTYYTELRLRINCKFLCKFLNILICDCCLFFLNTTRASLWPVHGAPWVSCLRHRVGNFQDSSCSVMC